MAPAVGREFVIAVQNLPPAADRFDYVPQQIAVLLVVLVLVVLANRPRWKGVLARHPMRALLAIVVLDFGHTLWATIPFLPIGVDEAYFAINVHVFHGQDLYHQVDRTPVPGLLASLIPWHPPLVGLLFKQGVTILAFVLARRPLGVGPALFAAVLTAIASRLADSSVHFQNAPYAAFFVVAFTLLASRGKWHLAALAAGLGFCSRWQVGALLPLAMLAAVLGQRTFCRGIGFVVVAFVLFFLPAVILVPLTGADPMHAFEHNTHLAGTPLSRLIEYLVPKISLGMSLPTLLLLVVGVWSIAYSKLPFRWAPELTWAAIVFVTYVCGVISIGTIMPNYFIPHTPIAAVLVAAGAVALGARLPWLRRPVVAGVLLAAVAVHLAMPVRPPKIRARKLANPAHAVYVDQAKIAAILGREHLYTDMEFLTVTAVLAHPCHAVIWKKSQHHGFVSMSFEGKFPDVTREALPRGVFYLTVDPAGRAPLWSGAGFTLVRW